MNCPTRTPIFFFLLFFVLSGVLFQTVTAQESIVLALHQDSFDPATEGWSQAGFNGHFNVNAFAVENDQETLIDAWAVDDRGEGRMGLYYVDLTPQKAELKTLPWVLSASIRAAEFYDDEGEKNGAVHVGLSTGDTLFRMFLCESEIRLDDASGSVARILPYPGIGEGYHDFQYRYDPLSQTVDFFVDGELRAKDIAGYAPSAFYLPSVRFGSQAVSGGAQGNYSLVKFELLPPLGDYDGDWLLTVLDIDMLTEAIHDPYDPKFDVNGNGSVSNTDRLMWVNDLKNTYFGDSNLDGEFNTGDLVEVLQAGKYETQEPAGWGEGDWDGDGFFGTGDLVFVLALGGYEEGPKDGVSAVPEPTSCILAWIAIAGLLFSSRKRVHSPNP